MGTRRKSTQKLLRLHRNTRKDGKEAGKSANTVALEAQPETSSLSRQITISLLNCVFYNFGSNYHLFTKDM